MFNLQVVVYHLQTTVQTKLSGGKAQTEFDGWLVELKTAHQGIRKVDHGHLEQEKEQLMVELKAVDMKMEEGERLRQKLIEIVANCEEMKQLLLRPKRPSSSGRICDRQSPTRNRKLKRPRNFSMN